MTETTNRHDYTIGDTVLARLGGVQIPGVISDLEDGRLTVTLSQPWTDETGRQSDTVTLRPDQVETFVEQETGGHQALPG